MLLKSFSFLGLAASAALAVAGPVQAAQLLTNGDFSSGLSGWTAYDTTNGTSSPNATTFDVTGFGASPAAGFRAGQVVSDFPFQAGGGLFQAVNFAGGAYSFRADWAARGGDFTNWGGVFTLRVNGLLVSSFNTGLIAPGAVVRGSLSFNGTLAAGNHVFAIEATRPFTTNMSAPTQFFDNAVLDNTPAVVPEPASWAMLLAGFGMVGGAMRRRSVAHAA
jgi:hypothetical protein